MHLPALRDFSNYFYSFLYAAHIFKQETRVQPLGQEDPLEEEMSIHSIILTQKIPRTEGYSSFGGKKSCMWLNTHKHFHKK